MIETVEINAKHSCKPRTQVGRQRHGDEKKTWDKGVDWATNFNPIYLQKPIFVSCWWRQSPQQSLPVTEERTHFSKTKAPKMIYNNISSITSVPSVSNIPGSWFRFVRRQQGGYNVLPVARPAC